MKPWIRYGWSSALTMACLACGTSGESTTPTPASDELVDRTIVHLNPDGTERVVTLKVSQRQQQQELAERPAALAAKRAGGNTVVADIILDNQCVGADLWVFGSSDCSASAGKTAEVCFYGQGTQDMSALPYCAPGDSGVCSPGGTWLDKIRSYWPGTENGYIHGVVGVTGFGGGRGQAGNESFSAYTSCTTAGYWGQRDINVNLTN